VSLTQPEHMKESAFVNCILSCVPILVAAATALAATGNEAEQQLTAVELGRNDIDGSDLLMHDAETVELIGRGSTQFNHEDTRSGFAGCRSRSRLVPRPIPACKALWGRLGSREVPLGNVAAGPRHTARGMQCHCLLPMAGAPRKQTRTTRVNGRAGGVSGAPVLPWSMDVRTPYPDSEHRQSGRCRSPRPGNASEKLSGGVSGPFGS